MALSNYFEKEHPDLDLGGLTYWEIGEIPLHSIYPQAKLFLPFVYRNIIEDEKSYLPHIHLNF